MSAIPFKRASGHTHPYQKPNPIGVVLHKTESSGFQHTLGTFLNGPLSPHFLIGKKDGEVVQLIDTQFQGKHVELANSLYVGIEFCSVPSRKGYEHKQDPTTIRDELTHFQVSAASDIISWISKTHGIPLVGPPSLNEMRACHGHWHGFCNHADVSAVIRGRGQHGEGLLDIDYIALGIWPAANRRGPSLLGEWLGKHPNNSPTPKEAAFNRWLMGLGKGAKR